MGTGKKLILPFLIILFILFALQKAQAVSEFISVYKNNGVDTNIRYDVTISAQDIAAAQASNPSCAISSWTLNTGYGNTDTSAANFDSVGNTNNAIKPITRTQNIFSEQNAYDILHNNGFDRVMLVLSFFGENESCEIRYPLTATPILFSSFPYSYPATTLTP
ncbi:MAG: hypothetical protein ACM3IJ_02405 [Candidatus Levyibacteriota bacterium]